MGVKKMGLNIDKDGNLSIIAVRKDGTTFTLEIPRDVIAFQSNGDSIETVKLIPMFEIHSRDAKLRPKRQRILARDITFWAVFSKKDEYAHSEIDYVMPEPVRERWKFPDELHLVKTLTRI